jgi:hypothetical protein
MDRAKCPVGPSERRDATDDSVEREDPFSRPLPVGLIVDPAIQQGLHIDQ